MPSRVARMIRARIVEADCDIRTPKRTSGYDSSDVGEGDDEGPCWVQEHVQEGGPKKGAQKST
jgi:hypothetical protein